MKFAVGQRIIVVQSITPLLTLHTKGYYGHVVNAFPENEILKQPLYDVQLQGRIDGPVEPIMLTLLNPYPFFEVELEAAD